MNAIESNETRDDTAGSGLDRPLRVGFDARWYNDSGVGTYVLELLRAMSQLPDLELTVYESPKNPLPLPAGKSFKKIAVRSGRYSLAGQWKLAVRCRDDRLDVFHSPFYAAPLAARCPVVVTVHDLIPFLFPIAPWPRQFLVKLGYRAAVAKAAHVITVSAHTANDVARVLRVSRERITAIPNAVRRDVFRREESPGELAFLEQKFQLRRPYIVAASARNWKTKNLGTALQALEVTQDTTGLNFQTAIYGPQEGFKAAGGTERWKGLNVRALGFVPSEELAAIFRHAELFIFPSLYEGFGLPALEAMSCGCPVITSTGGALAEVAGNSAQVFEPFDVEGMSGAARQLLRDSQNGERWRLSALARAAEFCWKRSARETASVYYRTYKQAYGLQ